jgi:hypothetical protein
LRKNGGGEDISFARTRQVTLGNSQPAIYVALRVVEQDYIHRRQGKASTMDINQAIADRHSTRAYTAEVIDE